MANLKNKVLNIALNKGNRILDRVYGKLDNRSIEVLMDEELEKHLKTNKKTILYVGRRYDYGNKNSGLSYQHYNFYHTLLNMDFSLIYFDYDRIIQRYGNKKMSQMLREAVYCYLPYLLFYFHGYDRIDHTILKEISDELPTKTVIFLSDDHFEYEETQSVWELFNIIVTTDREGYEKRKKEGFSNVLLSQWACNLFLYKNLNLPRIYGVSFVGRPHGKRHDFIETLKKQGVNITTFGQGWENGSRVSQADLIKIYNQSKISLNLSLTSRGGKIQIKTRDFEAPSCGSVLLTKDTKDIAEYFVPGEEIITYEDANDAAEKIKYYLENEEEREKIAKKGYERVIKDHTYEKRFLEIFEYAQNMGAEL
jgi:spore maturation protein CgeB